MLTKIKTESSNLQEEALIASLKKSFIICVFNTDGKIIYSNENFLKVLDISSHKEVDNAAKLLKSTVKSEAFFDEIWKIISNGEAWKGVLFHKGRNNETHYLETTITPVKDDNGTIIKYLAVSNDISNYYCAKTNNNLTCGAEKNLIENFTNDVLYINKYGKIINASKNATTNLYDSMIGLNIYDFVNPINHNYIQKQIHKVFTEGKKCKYQSMGLSPKGNQTLFVSKLKPVFNLHNEVIYATVKTNKHKSSIEVNNQLKAIETKYSNIFQSINVGIIVVANSMGNIIEWNKGAESAFGYTNAEIIGEPLTVLISKHQIDEGVKEILKAKDKLDNNLHGENIEMYGLKKNGEEFPVEFTMSHWRNGKEKFYCAFMLDISKRKTLEKKLEKTTKDLELFLYRSAHDLKSPITSAEGLLYLLKEEKLNERVTELVEMLDETLGKSRLLLDDMSFASIISEKRRDITVINFENKIHNTLRSLKRLGNFDSIKFQVDIQQTTAFYFNKELIDYVFQNLIRNSLCFAKPKTDTYTPSTHITVKSSDKEVRIIVSDNGLGIDNDHIDKIFDLYFRVCNENTQGTGLGLYIVKRIVDDFNGDIIVKSEINKGTSFEVILPNLIQNPI